MHADNGVIHFISGLLDTPVQEDIPERLASHGGFGTLLTAIEMAGLGEMLTEGTINCFFQGRHIMVSRIAFFVLQFCILYVFCL